MPRPDSGKPTPSGCGGGMDVLPVAADSLTYSVNGAHLIDNLQLYVGSPGVTVVLGPNGAGKSLLLRLLHGLIAAQSGTVRWGHQLISDEVRQHQALVFQKPVLLRRSVRANVEFVLRLRRHPDPAQRCEELLHMVGLQRQARQAARSLSGGEQQRLALARALAIDPDALLLDEPTASLDPASTSIIEEIVLKQCSAGVKIIFVTHDLGQARRVADDVVFMHRGRVVENTSASTFFNQPDTDIARAFISGQLIQ